MIKGLRKLHSALVWTELVMTDLNIDQLYSLLIYTVSQKTSCMYMAITLPIVTDLPKFFNTGKGTNFVTKGMKHF